MTDGDAFTFQTRGGYGGYAIVEGAEPSTDFQGVYRDKDELVGVTPSAGNGIWVRAERDSPILIITPGL